MPRGNTTCVSLVLAVVGACGALRAEQGVLVVHSANPRARPVTGVVLSTLGDGSMGPPSDRAGKTRIRLAPQTRPGAWVSLQIVRAPQDLVFISPWDSRVRVPPFENESENFVPVVLAQRGDRALLERNRAVGALAARICAVPPDESPGGGKTRNKALSEVARLFGLEPQEVDRALRSLATKSKNPYERGMSALYRLDYAAAERELAQAVRGRETSLRPVAANVLNAARFLGQALFEQGKYAEAAPAYRKALAIRPEDPELLAALGTSLVKAGSPAEGEKYLRRVLELESEARK